MTPATAATKQSRMRKATQEKHLLVANRSKFGSISIALYQYIIVTIISILNIFAQSFRQGGECIVELFLIHRIAWWGAMMAPLRKNALDPARFCHCHLTLKNLQNQSSMWRLDKASCLSIRRVIWILASDTLVFSIRIIWVCQTQPKLFS